MNKQLTSSLVFGASLLWGSLAWAESVTGSVEWAREARLGALSSGIVSEVAVQPGDRVSPGQPLVTLDPRAFEASLAEARARLEHLKLLQAEAQREFERAQEMYDRTLLSNHDLEVARLGLAAADAALAEGRKALVDAELALEYSVVRAPFGGVVTGRSVAEGETVVNRLESRVLVTVADASRMLARVLLPAERAAALQTGSEARVNVGGQAYSGRVAHVGAPAADGRYPVAVEFTPGERLPLPGQAAEVEL